MIATVPVALWCTFVAIDVAKSVHEVLIEGIFAGFLITDNASSFVGSISVRSSPDSSVA